MNEGGTSPQGLPGADARAVADSLVVVDLGSVSFARPAVRWMAARVVRDELRRGGGCSVLLQAADDEPLRRTIGVPVARPSDVLTPELTSECQDWVDSTSKEVVFGRGRVLFPDALGLSLADLNRLTVQVYLTEFAQVAAAMRALLGSGRVRRCRIVTGDADRALALREAAQQLVSEVSAWSPPLMAPARRLGYVARDAAAFVRRRGRPAAPAAGTDANAFAGPGLPERARVLCFSESVPMDQMFSAIEKHLSDEDCGGPVVRLQLGAGPREIRREGGVTVLRLGRPLTVPARRGGRFASRWYGGVERAVRTLDVRDTLCGARVRAPLVLIAEHMFLEVFDQQVEYLEYVKATLDSARPSLLVTGNDRWWVGQAFVLLARAANIPTLCLQDGLAGDNHFWWWVTADRFAAVSEMVADAMRRHGVPADRLAVTGQPRYDFLYAKRELSQRDARAELGLHEGGCYALFATQPHQTDDYVGSVVAAMLAVPGVHVLLRPHPSEHPNKYDAVRNAHPADRVSLQSGRNIFTLVVASDMLVTEFSTVALEAAALGRPVIAAVFAGMPASVQFGDEGVAVPARTPAELTAAVRRFAAGGASVVEESERQRLAAEDFLGVVDGRSGERAARLIREELAAADDAKRPASVPLAGVRVGAHALAARGVANARS